MPATPQQREQAVNEIIEHLGEKTMADYIPKIIEVLAALPSLQDQETVLNQVQQLLAAGTDVIRTRKFKRYRNHRNDY